MYIDKIFLVQFQTWFSFFWNLLIRMAELTRFFSLSLILVTLIIYYELWPSSSFFKSLITIIFTLLNSYFLFRVLHESRENFWPSIYKVRKKFEFELKLINNEIISFFDKLANIGNELPNASEKKLWEIYQSKNKSLIYSSYKFKLKYFFLNDYKISQFTKLSFLSWIILFIFLSNDIFYNNFSNSISIKKTFSDSYLDFSTNTWLYPPPGSKKNAIFFEHRNIKSKELYEKEDSFLIELGSKIQVNFFNMPIRDIKIKLINKKTKRSKYLNKLVVIDNSTIRFEKKIEEGEYIILIKNKVFQKIIINFDKPPKVNFKSDIKITDNKIKFYYSLIDENNKKIWLDVFSNNELIKKSDKPKLDLLNKIYSKPIHYLEIKNNVSSIKKNNKKELDEKFSRDISYLPILSGKIFLRLRSIDVNDQLGKSEVKSIFFKEENFYDPVSSILIKIRQDLFINEDINNSLVRLKELILKQKDVQRINRLKSLINILENKKLSKNDKIEKSLIEMWRLAIFLENKNLENLENKILNLKKDLEKLINKNMDQKLIYSKMNELELLLKKYEELINSNNEKLNMEKGSLKENELDELIQNEDSLKNKVKKLLSRVEDLLNKKKNTKEANKILDNINEIYKKQKQLIEETYNTEKSYENRDQLINKQARIIKEYQKISKKIKNLLPQEILSIDEIESKMKEIKKKFERSEIKETINFQIKILSSIEDLYKKLKSKSKTRKNNKKNSNGNKNKNGEQANKKFDVPIIFEKNELDKIINRIREMTNEQDRDPREKSYLKRLLPIF